MIQNELKINITNSLDVYEYNRTGDVEEYSLTPTYTGREAQIVPAGTDILVLYPEIPAYQAFDIFIFTNDVIKNGDKLVDGGDTWIVRGVSFKIDGPLMTFQRLVGQKMVGS